MIAPEDVTAVLVTRGDVPQLISDRIAQFQRLGMKHVLWNNATSAYDLKVYGRYEAADRMATTKIVFFQDDDIVLTDEQILNILANYEPGILVSNMYDDWIESMQYFDLAMVGLGAVCDNGLWHDAFKRWKHAYGEDPSNEDRFLLDPDFIFGVLAKWRRFDFGHEILPEASADNRLWRQEGQHERKYETVDMARRLRTVCLTMLVKNESENLPRALKSAAGWYDRVLLLDTGSTDDTITVAEATAGALGKPIDVIETEFTNFAEMRTLLLEEGRKRGDYMLLMDADEEWINVPERPPLALDAYMIHYEGGVDYAQARVISSRFPWKWSGVTHSYLDWDWEGEVLAVNMQEPLIIHHGDDRHGDTKVMRDIELLEAEIARTDDDLHRNLFLLGKAYDGTSQWMKAKIAYQRRIDLGSNDAEDYWCRLRLGNILCEEDNDMKAGIETLWEAYQSRPQRVEALRAIAFYCTAVADATPYPEDDITLVLRDQYRVT